MLNSSELRLKRVKLVSKLCNEFTKNTPILTKFKTTR